MSDLVSRSVYLVALVTLFAATQGAVFAQDAQQVAVSAAASEKLSAELAAAKLSGGRLVGLTEDGRAVVEVTEPEKQQLAEVADVQVSEKVAPEEVEEVTELIVMYEPGQAVAQATLQAAGLNVVDTHEAGSFVVVRAPAGFTAVALGALEADPGVTRVEPNYTVRIIPPPPEELAAAAVEAESAIQPTRVPNDTDFSKLWGMLNIRAPEAWNTVTSSPVVVAVIDTGVDHKHPDLAANMWKNPGEVAGDNKDNDGNGIVDDVHGADYVNNDGDPMDDNRHGTHCAGTIGAVGGNGAGVVGVAWRVKIMALKFLSAGGSGSTSNAIKCIDYARQKGARVMSNSWGGGGYSKALEDAITRAQNAGILFVAAAGNHNGDNDARPSYPASYKNDNIVSVLSIDRDDKKSSFSCYGKTSVDIGAPGRDIFSTLPSNKYGSLSGTSMATPHVSGAAALVWGHPVYDRYSSLSVKRLLMNNARRLPDLSGKCVTGGTLNIAFLEQAVTTILTKEAYNHFRNVTIKKNMAIVSVSFTLQDTMFVHMTAHTTARLASSKPVTIANGLITVANPNAVFTYSLRRAKFDAKGDVEPISTSFGTRMGPGRHTVYWNVWVPSDTELVTDSGTLMIEAFGAKVGGILEIDMEPDISEMTDEGTIKRQVTVIEELGGQD